jgi:hypothetical protein
MAAADKPGTIHANSFPPLFCLQNTSPAPWHRPPHRTDTVPAPGAHPGGVCSTGVSFGRAGVQRG